METNFTIKKTKRSSGKLSISKALLRWGGRYICAMSKALYPPETRGVQSKNDRHRIFYK
ncbi:hypothetical protein M0D21_01110 [Aquimarina sp. D1M17]|uniref:hypothetical protein n=1 Tax=Aquimarina acroporae TaxID=2937283 RepID=UPI0020C086EB|nr:hypothetical protein [Aquimarina acroporae]MCK8520150.1 hypothetical protein [Aquimarina acroporae]